MHVNMEIIVPRYVHYINMDMVPCQDVCVCGHVHICRYV